MLVFYPKLLIKYPWEKLITKVRDVATNYVHTDIYKQHLLYEQGASEVTELIGGGWVSKQANSHDFFVMGGIPETNYLESKFKELFPLLTFTPGTIGYSSRSVPKHKDHNKNGMCSLIYPLHDHNSISRVYGNTGITEEYGFSKDVPVILDITQHHEVINTGERIWFSIHCHQGIDHVHDEFSKHQQIFIE